MIDIAGGESRTETERKPGPDGTENNGRKQRIRISDWQ